jgi:hypothetical protein
MKSELTAQLLACTRRPVKDKGALMQTLHLRFRDLRAVSPGALPPADGVPVRCAASDQEERRSFPNPSRPTCAVGLRPAAPVALIGTGPESGAVPRGRQRQRAIRFHLSQGRDRLPDQVCRATLIRQTAAYPGDGPVRHRQHDRPPVGGTACLPVCAVACPPGWPADSEPVCMSASLHAGQSASLCPSPVR